MPIPYHKQIGAKPKIYREARVATVIGGKQPKPVKKPKPPTRVLTPRS